MSVPTYLVRVTRDPVAGAWLVASPDKPELHTWGRSIAAARTNAADAMVQLGHREDEVALVYEVSVGDRELEERVRAAADHHAALEEARTRLAPELADVARRLVAAGLTYRDAADLLGLSHSRVAQLVTGA